jgi:crotonobetainyl-CoA:carnitine CoA-transferase CaiB-like acyl-CoA transferase
MLAPYRVIDLSNERGLLCGQILADLGADVIAVEPVEGSSARRCGPWAKGQPGSESSLFWWAYARNKRSVAVDFESPEGIAEIKRLSRGADFLIESSVPGEMARLGLSYEDLSRENPGLIYVSISAFGQQGPKAQWHDSDLTQMASSGHAYLTGDAERPPLRLCVPQGHAHAGSDAAVGALIAHFERKSSGLGQHVDISIQQSTTLATMFRTLDVPLEQAPAERLSGGVHIVGQFVPTRFALRDGHVVLGPAFLPSTGHFMNRLLDFAEEEGFKDPALDGEDWGSFAIRVITGELPPKSFEPVEALLTSFFATKTKSEIMAAALERKLLAAPVLGLGTIVDSEQIAEREFSFNHSVPDFGTSVRFPGPFAKFSEMPIRSRLRPPTLGQHNNEIAQEDHRTPAALTRPAARSTDSTRPLEGVKILDLFWVLAGPGSTRMLADYGATVVRVESQSHLDTLRVIPPYQFSHPHPEGAGGFQSANANKLGVTIEISSEGGREILRELVSWADVVTESFAPGVIASHGLGYEALRKIKPDVIMISSCLMGQSGPWRNFTGFGNLAAAVTGFSNLASWPGHPPPGPYGAYTDFIGVRYNALAILAALDHRDRTGVGQYIDMSQAESALHFLAPAYLDYTVNGEIRSDIGNQDLERSPHDFYPCAGDDRWIAISVLGDDEWKALCELMGRDDLASHREDRERVDAAIAEWTSSRQGDVLEADLQKAGIAAHRALDMPELHADEQMNAREHYYRVTHKIYQEHTIESSRLRLSRSAEKHATSALCFGRDNRFVFESILGYSSEQIDALIESGVLGPDPEQ